MQAAKMTSKTVVTLKVTEAELRRELGLGPDAELTSAIAEPDPDGGGTLVVTFLLREATLPV
jgi:hypothetical protein